MAQIHALTPEGRLPTAAVAHVQELVGYRSGVRVIPLTPGVGWVGGRVALSRVGSTCTVAVRDLVHGGGAAGYVPVASLGNGFRPHDTIYARTDRGSRCRIDAAGNIQVFAPGASWDAFSFTLVTLDAPPATPPGSNG